MSAFLFGPDGGVPAGYVKCPAGTPLLRGHRPGREPNWYGPKVGSNGVNRFDMPHRATADDPGTCYFAPTLEGVLLEVVTRNVSHPVLSLHRLRTDYRLARVTVGRDLVLVDLIKTVFTVHGLEVNRVTAAPPYHETQALAKRLAADSPTYVDGIAYSSRFGSVVECIALWHRAAGAMAWHGSEPLGSDDTALAAACNRLGIGLLP